MQLTLDKKKMFNVGVGDGDDGHHQRHQLPETNREQPCPATLVAVFLGSFKILLFNPRMFTSIFLLFGLPLSLLLASLSVSSTILRRRISHLESLSAIISVRIEALNILEEARKDAKSLFRLRASYALPALLLSTLLLVSSASFAAAPFLHRHRFSLSDLPAVVRASWWRSLVTAVVGHLSIAGYGQLMRTAAVALDVLAGPVAAVAVGLLSAAVEIYLAAVVGMGAVVSVVEERFGLDAVRVGWGLMQGRRTVGLAVMGAVAASTGLIGWEMVGAEEIDVYGGDREGLKSTAVMEFGRKAGLMVVYGLVLVWSNVVFTVFYCDCRKKKVGVVDVDDVHHELVLVDNLTAI